MEQPSDRQSRLRGNIPRLSTSRLPVPRAPSQDINSTRSLAASGVRLYADESHDSSTLRRPSFRSQSRAEVPKVLGENVNETSNAHDSSKSVSDGLFKKPASRPISPNKFDRSSFAILETTPPARTFADPGITGLDENSTVARDEVSSGESSSSRPLVLQEKRKPRLSLSDRTIETLSQLPPSPSPGKRKSNFFHSDCMGPPSRPLSAAGNSKVRVPFGKSVGSRSACPPMQPSMPPLPAVPPKTPPVAHLSRLPLASPWLSTPKLDPPDQSSVLTRPNATIRKAGTFSKTFATRRSQSRASLSSIFQDTLKPRSMSMSPDRSKMHRNGVEMMESHSQRSEGSSISASSSTTSLASSLFQDSHPQSSLTSSAPSETVERDSPTSVLKLASTNLTVFPAALLTQPGVMFNLESLDLSHNPMESADYLCEPIWLPKLKSLSLVSTGLTSLEAMCTYLSAPELTELNISCHRLSGPVPRLRETFPKLSVVLATDNWFTELNIESVQGLTVLDLTNNPIEDGIDSRSEDWRTLECDVRI